MFASGRRMPLDSQRSVPWISEMAAEVGRTAVGCPEGQALMTSHVFWGKHVSADRIHFSGCGLGRL